MAESIERAGSDQRTTTVPGCAVPAARFSTASLVEALDTVVLKKDMPAQRLKAGDDGAVVEIYGSTGLEVEFVIGAGRTQALATLGVS